MSKRCRIPAMMAHRTIEIRDAQRREALLRAGRLAARIALVTYCGKRGHGKRAPRRPAQPACTLKWLGITDLTKLEKAFFERAYRSLFRMHETVLSVVGPRVRS